MAVDTTFASWLKSDALYVSSAPASAGVWGDSAQASTLVSPLALKADAEAEAARQSTFLAGPLVVDEHDVQGARKDLIGRTITITGDRLGYEQGRVAFVIGAQEGAGITTLTVITRMQ